MCVSKWLCCWFVPFYNFITINSVQTYFIIKVHLSGKIIAVVFCSEISCSAEMYVGNIDKEKIDPVLTNTC